MKAPSRAGFLLLAFSFLGEPSLLAQEKFETKDAGAKTEEKPSAAAALRQAVFNRLKDKTGAVAMAPAPKGEAWGWADYEAASKHKDATARQYKLILSHLLRAEQLLKSDNKADQRTGLGMALEACHCATDRLKDAWLSVHVADAFLVPNLDAADELGWQLLSAERVINACLCAYVEAKDDKKYIEGYRLLLKYGEASKDRNTADAARLKLAEALERKGDFEEALQLLAEVDPQGSLSGGLMMVPRIEKKLADKKAGKKPVK